MTDQSTARTSHFGTVGAGLLITSLLLCSPAHPQDAEPPTVSFQFTQTGFADGGLVRVFVSGQDTNGDGKLYTMGAFGVDVFGFEAGDEVEFMTVTFDNVNGRTFTQRYDRNVAGADAQENFFYGFSYNLDGGPIGDTADEGLSLSPFAPSTSYVLGPLFAPYLADTFPDTPLGACGDGAPCGNVVSLIPGAEPMSLDVTFGTFSAAAVPVSEELRFSFSQGGFPNGGRIHGTITGRDLNGDGRLLGIPDFLADTFGYEAGDEILSASVTFENFDGGRSFTNVFDTSIAGINDPSNSFMGFSYDLDGGPLGDAPTEGISISPFAPSTSYVLGEFFSQLVNPAPLPDTPLGTCGDEETGACAVVVSLEPGAVFPDVEVTFSEASAGNVTTLADPDRVRASHSGSWYDTARSGEGLLLQLLPNGRALINWLSYDALGGQRWFVGTGRTEGQTIEVDELVETSGGVFGQAFSPDAIERTVAGTMSIQFDGCDSGTLRYLVDGEAGELQLTRLTAVSSLACAP